MQPPLTDSEVLAEYFEIGNISGGDGEVIDVSDGFEEEPMGYSGKSAFLFP